MQTLIGLHLTAAAANATMAACAIIIAVDIRVWFIYEYANRFASLD